MAKAKDWLCRVCGTKFQAEEEPLECPTCAEEKPLVLHCRPCVMADDRENSPRLQALIVGKSVLRLICRQHGLVSSFNVLVMDPTGGLLESREDDGA